MLFLRRLLLTLSVAALLCSAAAVTGYAVSGRHEQPPSGNPTLPAPTARPSAPTTPAASPDQPTVPAEPSGDPAERPSTPPRPVEPQLEPGATLLGPGDRGPQVREVQARLKQIAWFFGDVTGRYGDLTRKAVRGFQEKRKIPVTGEVDRRTLNRLEAMTSEPTHAELHNIVVLNGNRPGPLDARCRVGRVICVDKTSQTLRWVVDGVVRQTLDVRFGSSYTPTREGVFHVYTKSRDHVSKLYGSSMPYAMFFSGGQAVHYSPDFASVGYAGASHGCVNVRDRNGVAQLFDQVQVGDTVVVYWS